MASVIDIRTKLAVPNLDATQPLPKEKLAESSGSSYQCSRCEARTFKLFVDGLIKCAECEVPFNNITVIYTKGAKA